MKITKKYVIEQLRACGVKATYNNVVWCFDRFFNIVGGINHGLTSSAMQLYFIVKHSDVIFVNSFNDIKEFIK